MRPLNHPMESARFPFEPQISDTQRKQAKVLQAALGLATNGALEMLRARAVAAPAAAPATSVQGPTATSRAEPETAPTET